VLHCGGLAKHSFEEKNGGKNSGAVGGKNGKAGTLGSGVVMIQRVRGGLLGEGRKWEGSRRAKWRVGRILEKKKKNYGVCGVMGGFWSCGKDKKVVALQPRSGHSAGEKKFRVKGRARGGGVERKKKERKAIERRG